MQEQPPDENTNKIESRFKLATNESARERLDNFRSEVKNFQKEHPEVLGATVYGSMIKGSQAKETSDIDAFLYIDQEALPEEEKLSDSKELETKYRNKFLENIQASPEEIKNYYVDMRAELLSDNILDKDIESRIEYDQKYKDYRIMLNEKYPGASPDEQERLLASEPEFKQISSPIAGMFHARIGTGIEKYRKSFIEKIVSLPNKELAEDIWKDVCTHLNTMEQRSDPSKKIEIPSNLNDAMLTYHPELYKELNRKKDEEEISKLKEEIAKSISI